VEARDRVKIRSEQGIEMGRPSRLEIELDLGAGGQVTRVGVGGRCVLMGGGWLELD
jgi:predicted PhzF superfamily epimerase YddE/YHI9